MFVYSFVHYNFQTNSYVQYDVQPQNDIVSQEGFQDDLSQSSFSNDTPLDHLDIKRHNCEFTGCKRTYSTVGNLRTHMKTHKGTRVTIRFFKLQTQFYYYPLYVLYGNIIFTNYYF